VLGRTSMHETFLGDKSIALCVQKQYVLDPLYINLCLKKAGGFGKDKKYLQKEERGE
jgi:hypothetical protein